MVNVLVIIHRAKTSSTEAKVAKPYSLLWDLRLYVAGETPKLVAAIANLKQLCEKHPTLVRKLPPGYCPVISWFDNAQEQERIASPLGFASSQHHSG